MTSLKHWIGGARPRTLPAAIAPVLVGSAIAYQGHAFSPEISALAMVVALAMQVGVNYSNDYSDGIRGTDDHRIGPVRLVGQKLASARSVRNAALVSYSIGSAAGLGMVALSDQWLLIPVGIAAVIAGWFYTGGPRPYGYAGFGELFVFLFFGLVAVIGTSAPQLNAITSTALLAGIGCGLLSTAILLINNLRDIPTDSVTGKKTLAVRIGDPNTRALIITCLAVAGAIPAMIPLADVTAFPWALTGLVAIPASIPVIRPIVRCVQGKELIPVLANTGRLLLIYSIALSAGILLSA